MSDNNNNNVYGGGVGISFVVFIVFLILKLTGMITWSWWWITAPLWIGWCLLPLTVIIIVFVVILIVSLITDIW